MTVIHVPDDKYPLSARVLFQYLLTAQGSIYELKPLFMSADSKEEKADASEADELNQNGAQWDSEDVTHWSERRERDCVVCQNARVNRVLLPCRHTCVCDGCVLHFQRCPICRAFITESFSLKTQVEGHWFHAQKLHYTCSILYLCSKTNITSCYIKCIHCESLLLNSNLFVASFAALKILTEVYIFVLCLIWNKSLGWILSYTKLKTN